MWIILPILIKIKALKKAWDRRWKNAKFHIPHPKVVIITPNCLRVERATIFFISISTMAVIPAISIVAAPKAKTTKEVADFLRRGRKRINRYTPAVTRVEEWTSEETGVGAAIAAGSQAEKGIWALLVNLASTTSNNGRRRGLPPKEIKWNSQVPNQPIAAIAARIKTSPTRFLRTVSIPAFDALGLW